MGSVYDSNFFRFPAGCNSVQLHLLILLVGSLALAPLLLGSTSPWIQIREPLVITPPHRSTKLVGLLGHRDFRSSAIEKIGAIPTRCNATGS